MSNPESVMEDAKRRMDGAINAFKHVLTGLRTGRASASLLDPIKVEVYGNFVPVSQLGTISVPDPRMISIQIWDKSIVKSVEKTIAAAGLGLNPVSDGQVLRIPIPDLTEQRRKELAKKVSEYAEQSRVALRNIRRDSMDDLKKMEKEKLLSEDQLKTYTNNVQQLINDFICKIESLADQKSREILTI